MIRGLIRCKRGRGTNRITKLIIDFMERNGKSAS